MKKSLLQKLEVMYERFQEVNLLLADANIIASQNQFRTLSKEYSQLEPVINCFIEYNKACQDVLEINDLINGDDKDLAIMAKDELDAAQHLVATLDEALQKHLIPKDPDDERNIYLEIRAGTGGDEAAIFAGDLFRMYSRYSETKGWRVEIVNAHHGEHGGFKEIIAQIQGQNVYSELKFESGAHRVQRVPETESQGRVHTSACTVAILPEVDEIDEIPIKPMSYA